MAYHFPTGNLTNASNIVEIADYANDVTSGLFFPLMLFGVWIILFVAMLRWGERQAFTASSFSTALIAILLAAVELVNPVMILAPMGMTVFGILIMKGRGD